MKTQILADFQICISVPLNLEIVLNEFMQNVKLEHPSMTVPSDYAKNFNHYVAFN